MELRTPVLEYTDLFRRSIGEETDVVQKEMFTFPDRKGRMMTMRPEATAGVMRAYVEDARYSRESVSRLFTTGPMFRYERPQKGRMRQFHQVDCELLGTNAPAADAEIISLLIHYVTELGLSDLSLHMNNLGCPNCRPKYRQALVEYLTRHEEHLCDDCKRRLHTNPLRVLDCKKDHDLAFMQEVPVFLDYVCDDCKAHYETVTALLQENNIDFVQDHCLVRGLDYYCRTTFELQSNAIGAQTAVAGGGRYDGLIRNLGGPDVPGIGFACGMERLALLLEGRELPAVSPDFYVAVLDDSCRDAAFALAQNLRREGFSGTMGYESRSMKATMRQAGKSGARYTLIMGTDELAAGTVIIKNMESGEQREVPCADVAAGLNAEK